SAPPKNSPRRRRLTRRFEPRRVSGQQIAARQNPDHPPGIIATNDRDASHVFDDHEVSGVAQRVMLEHNHRRPANELGESLPRLECWRENVATRHDANEKIIAVDEWKAL